MPDAKHGRRPSVESGLRATLDRWLGAFVSLLLGILVLDVLWQVASRFLLGSPSPWTEELARYLLVWLGLFGAALAAGQRRHLAVDLLAGRLGARGRRRVEQIGQLAVVLFAVFVLIGGGTSLVRLVAGLGQRSAALGIPLASVYLALPLSGLLTVVYMALDLFAPKPSAGRDAAP